MPYIEQVKITPSRSKTYPFNIPSIINAKDIALDSNVTVLIGDNGIGKSTLLEAIAVKLKLPRMDLNSNYNHKDFNSARMLEPYLHLTHSALPSGLFFRPIDLPSYIESLRNSGEAAVSYFKEVGITDEYVIKMMSDSQNFYKREMVNKFGFPLEQFSHGEACLKVMSAYISKPGVYILDEPEAALSPIRQLELISIIINNVKKYGSQFIIATHSPLFMAISDSKLFEIGDNLFEPINFKETVFFTVIRDFLNSPDAFMRSFNC